MASTCVAHPWGTISNGDVRSLSGSERESPDLSFGEDKQDEEAKNTNGDEDHDRDPG